MPFVKTSDVFASEKGSKDIKLKSNNGAIVNLTNEKNTEIKNRILTTKDGIIANKTIQKLIILNDGEIEIEKNDTIDPEAEYDTTTQHHTGVLHNYTTISSKEKTGKITGGIIGDGYIYNYEGFVKDEDRDKQLAVYQLTPVSSTNIIANQAYYDLAASSRGVTNFRRYAKGVVEDTVNIDDGSHNGANANDDGRAIRLKTKTSESGPDLFNTSIDNGNFIENDTNEANESSKIAYNLIAFDGKPCSKNYVIKNDSGGSETIYSDGHNDIELKADSPKILKSSIHSLTGYKDGILGNLPSSGSAYGMITKTGTSEDFKANVIDKSKREADWGPADPVLIVDSDCSWYHGIFHLKEGGMIIKETGSMFGGDICLNCSDVTRLPNDSYGSKNYSATNGDQEVELEWQGGPKDKYNKPRLYLGNDSKVFFNLVNQNGENNVFSFYGNIASVGDQKTLTGNTTDKVIFEKGLVYIRGDCSRFTGSVQVYNGAEFIVRNNDDDFGKMFGGTYEVLNDSGVPDPNAEIIVKSNAGLRPLTLNTGTMRIQKDEGNEGENSQQKVNEINVGENGTVILEYGNTLLEKTTIKGNMELSGGEYVDFAGLDLDGGTILISGDKLETLKVTGEIKTGSSIKAWGNNIIDDIYFGTEKRDDGNYYSLNDGTTWEMYDGRGLEFYIDLDPSQNRSDRIIANSVNFTNPNIQKLEIPDYRVLNEPTEQIHVFQVLKLLEAKSDADYLKIALGSEAASKEIKGKYGTYKLYVEGGAGYVTLRTDKATTVGINDISPDKKNELTPEQLNILNNKFIPLQVMHMSGLTKVSEIYSMVCDTLGYSNKENILKHSFWNKSYGSIGKESTSSNKISTTEYGSIFGFDAKPIQLKNQNTYFMPTIFGNYTSRNMDYNLKKSKQNQWLFGGKLTWFNHRLRLDLLGSYESIKTNITPAQSLKSDIYSVGAKIGYSIDIGNLYKFIPELLSEYSLIRTKKFNLGSNIEGDNVAIRNKKINQINITPGINIVRNCKGWKASVGAHLHSKFGSSIKSMLNDQIIPVTKYKKNYMEYSIGINKVFQDQNKELGLKISKTTNGNNSLKATISAAIKF